MIRRKNTFRLHGFICNQQMAICLEDIGAYSLKVATSLKLINMQNLNENTMLSIEGGGNARCFFFGALACLGSYTNTPGSAGFIPLCVACSNT